jgi:inositol oxygenase
MSTDKNITINSLRIYNTDTIQYDLYRNMHKNQDLQYVINKKKQYSILDNKIYSMKDALQLLNTFIDPSDPDLDEENLIHGYQTAERIRNIEPANKELQLIGLIHDVGKILYSFGEPNWAVVGDTYVVGCKYPKSIVYYDTLTRNKDFNKYDDYGIYKYKCGLDNLHLSFGHDEYLYQVLQQNKNKHKISQKYMDVIRYHSFYPWHTSDEYKFFMSEKDNETLKNVKCFNRFDLYSKEDTDFILTKDISAYYDKLIDEYFKKDLQW